MATGNRHPARLLLASAPLGRPFGDKAEPAHEGKGENLCQRMPADLAGLILVLVAFAGEADRIQVTLGRIVRSQRRIHGRVSGCGAVTGFFFVTRNARS
jgi:hypothetical protein